MKLLLFLISLSSFFFLGKACNQGGQSTDTKNESDTLKVVIDSLPASIDSAATRMNSQPAASTATTIDTLAKDTKYESTSGKHEAPKHGSPNQEKIDSTKAAKKKKKD